MVPFSSDMSTSRVMACQQRNGASSESEVLTQFVSRGTQCHGVSRVSCQAIRHYGADRCLRQSGGATVHGLLVLASTTGAGRGTTLQVTPPSLVVRSELIPGSLFVSVVAAHPCIGSMNCILEN